jgi:Spy/CpxP family protein refolding chaperone
MKKQHLLWLAIFILFALNIATISFIAFRTPGHPPPPGHGAFDQLVLQTLQLNEEQEHRFHDLKRAHHEAIMQLDKAMKPRFEQYFRLLLDNRNDTVTKKQLELAMADIYQQKLQVTYRHFDQLKSICSPEQQQHFDKLIPELMQVMQPAPPAGQRPPVED